MHKTLWTDAIAASANLENLPRLIDWMGGCLEKCQGPQKLSLRYLLALEEVVVNILNYAYPEREGEVKVFCSFDAQGVLAFTFEDQGVAFNPLDFPKVPAEASLEDRKIGGLGIMLMRQSVDDVHYERAGSKNLLTLKKQMR